MSLRNPGFLIKSICVFAIATSSALLTNAALTPPAGNTLTLSWDANPETNLQDYRVYAGTQSGNYNQTYDAATATSFLIEQLEAGQTYYFAVMAIGSTGLESPLSAELVVTIATPPLPTGSQLTMGASGKLDLQWTFPTSAMGSSPEFRIQASADLENWTEVATVLAESSLGGADQLEHFSWTVPTTVDERKFYRLTATNWLGSSAAP